METFKVTDKYVFFWGDDIYSNFAPTPIEYGPFIFPTGEHFYQWRKAAYFGDLEAMNHIAQATNPATAKKIGKKIRFFRQEEWDLVREPIMKDVLWFKVTQNPNVKDALHRDGDGRHFVEASPFDSTWGIGFDIESAGEVPNLEWGSNLFGKTWDSVYDAVFGRVRNSNNMVAGNQLSLFDE